MEWAAKRRFPYLMVFTPITRIAQIYSEYREACERYGYIASPYQLTVNLPIIVAENDTKAHELAQAHALWATTWGCGSPLPSGGRPAPLRAVAAAGARQPGQAPHRVDVRGSRGGGYIICGSPATVRDN